MFNSRFCRLVRALLKAIGIKTAHATERYVPLARRNAEFRHEQSFWASRRMPWVQWFRPRRLLGMHGSRTAATALIYENAPILVITR